MRNNAPLIWGNFLRTEKELFIKSLVKQHVWTVLYHGIGIAAYAAL
jgi:hypothetical protein